MNGRVRMVHPGLPEDQTIMARPSAVRIYQASGWQIADDPASESAAGPEPGAEPPAAARRRQKTIRGSTAEIEE